ncbi:signal peptide peptidase-like 2B [Octopus vulgaris]|uniref:Signal peptide peptidase-like 2B n=1 Tax=Octopus vulgaris TaxID=6645 RepID=A0AA36BEB4_OCTVU|nr:signal peptide peptidase-like 2B [Octopus vulgaris]
MLNSASFPQVSPHLCQVFILLLWSLIYQANGQNLEDRAVLSAYGEEDPSQLVHFCIPYNHEFHVLPESQSAAKFYRLVDFSSATGCSEDTYVDANLSQAVVTVMRGDCSFSVKASIVAKLGAVAIINISPSNESLIIPGGNKTDYMNINISVALMRDIEFATIKHLGDNIKCQLYSPQPTLFGLTEAVIFLLALISIVIGSYWSGVLFYEENEVTAEGHKPLESENSDDADKERKLKASQKLLSISVPVVIFLIIVMSTFLLGLYFFYNYLVYVVIVIFMVAASIAFYSCFKPLWNYIIPGKQRLKFNLGSCCKADIMYKEIVLLMLGFAAGITWLVLRHKPYSWILQDILGVLFCINVLKNLRIPSLKAGTLLLGMFFLYDIFFVFLTPLFTENGESVMVDVATGKSGHHSESAASNSMPRSLNVPDNKKDVSSTREVLPLVFRVPPLFPSHPSVCFVQESLLGFGDVILPGVLVVYSHIFDIYVRAKKLYLVISIFGYLLGLLLAFVALTLMQAGQPALLYLVPTVLLSAVIPSCCRGEFREMWTGDFLNFLKASPPVEDRSLSQETLPDDVETPPISTKPDQSKRNENDHLLN